MDWIKFLDANSKEGLEMLAEKNENIKTAYEILKRVSKSKEARMAYDARQAEIMDQLTREETARAEGMEKGREEGIEKVAKSLLDVLDDETISAKTGLTVEFVKGLRK
ncbi:PD-(D/E)XK nuclease family transposase [Clostridium sp. CS001]|nr:PD-(D/E)XK nuclease family transposase [Clostridium sp. CS001]